MYKMSQNDLFLLLFYLHNLIHNPMSYRYSGIHTDLLLIRPIHLYEFPKTTIVEKIFQTDKKAFIDLREQLKITFPWFCRQSLQRRRRQRQRRRRRRRHRVELPDRNEFRNQVLQRMPK